MNFQQHERLVCELFRERGNEAATYFAQARQNRSTLEGILKTLLSQRRPPLEGLPVNIIEALLQELSLMDSNNFVGRAGVGEREGRFFSSIVAERHFGLMHGIGRSGVLTALQPKALGSSLVAVLCSAMVKSVIKSICGIRLFESIEILPYATGMALMQSYIALKKKRSSGKVIIWSRIDQKSCVKSMTGLLGVCIDRIEVVPQVPDPTGALCTDLMSILRLIEFHGHENVLCVSLTTSTFAPRSPDDIIGVSGICAHFSVPVIVNNAYGLQCSLCCHMIEESMIRYPDVIQAIVQSCDKNFLVPVGGAIVLGPLAMDVGKLYPGRASGSQYLDMFITLLELGMQGYKKSLDSRKELFTWFVQELGKREYVRIIDTPKNRISVALDVSRIAGAHELGTKLFMRGVTGARLWHRSTAKPFEDCGLVLNDFGSHSPAYMQTECYLNAAVALGASKRELEEFLAELDKLVRKSTSPI